MVGSNEPTRGEVTRLLRVAREGDREALDRVLLLVYEDLRGLARRQLRGEYGGRTIEPTALVHEAYLKLVSGSALEINDRAHFLAIAARAMRQVLVDHARRRRADKRGGGWARTTLADDIGWSPLDPEELLALDAALESLEERQRMVVECRFFAGMEEEEVATVLGVSTRTVRRDWVKARAWLNRALYIEGSSGRPAAPEPNGAAASAPSPSDG